MRYIIKVFRQYLPWLIFLICIDLFWALLLWLADIRAFYSLSVVIILATIILFFVLGFVLVGIERKRENAFLEFLYSPDEYHEGVLLEAISSSHRDDIRMLGKIFREKQSVYTDLQMQLNDYEEYIESWAHEAKTPLSLLTLLLDNHRDELPISACFKLDYIRNRIQEAVEQILFYARLKSARKDYLFENINIRMCIDEVLEDYKPLLEEKKFNIKISLPDEIVYSDRRGIYFLIGQVISNSVKYCKSSPELCFNGIENDGCYVLSIRDNGIGVRSCDLPYIFEKGFTGDTGDGRRKATGMGLYLAKEVAGELNVNIDVNSEWGKGFEMRLSFPVVVDR